MPKPKIVTHAGHSMTLKEWATHLGVEYKTLWMRLRDGMSYEKAFSKTVERAAIPRDPEKTISKACLNCSASFLIPKCRDWRENCCSSSCKVDYRKKQSDALRLSRTRECRHCSTLFVVKKSQIDDGAGNYCSYDCHREHYGIAHLFRPGVQELAIERRRQTIASGNFRTLRGADNPRWRGGKEAARLRNAPKVRELAKKWRAANKEVMRERADRRSRLKGGKRLPRGTVAKLLEAQRNKCPICRKPLKGKYHVDHVIPLARGGQHEPLNIQILCPTCNVRKSAKDPIAYMQERGFLI